MSTPSDVIRIARTYIDTPFHRDGRVKGVGIDCIGLPVCVARELGADIHSMANYRAMPKSTRFQDAVKVLKLVQREPGPGTMLAFQIAQRPVELHFGIMTGDGTIIHTNDNVGKVTEHILDGVWRKRILSAWAFPGVEY